MSSETVLGSLDKLQKKHFNQGEWVLKRDITGWGMLWLQSLLFFLCFILVLFFPNYLQIFLYSLSPWYMTWCLVMLSFLCNQLNSFSLFESIKKKYSVNYIIWVGVTFKFIISNHLHYFCSKSSSFNVESLGNLSQLFLLSLLWYWNYSMPSYGRQYFFCDVTDTSSNIFYVKEALQGKIKKEEL